MPTFKIKLIEQADTYDIRKRVLRNNTLDESLYKWDINHKGAQQFHVGAFSEDNILIGIASFYEEALIGEPKIDQITDSRGFRLRGIGIEPDFQGNGLGKKLVLFAIDILKEKKIDYLWCNSKAEVTGFYNKKGFKKIGEEFSIPKIGKVVKMVKYLYN